MARRRLFKDHLVQFSIRRTGLRDCAPAFDFDEEAFRVTSLVETRRDENRRRPATVIATTRAHIVGDFKVRRRAPCTRPAVAAAATAAVFAKMKRH